MAFLDEEDESKQQIKRIKTLCNSENHHSILTLPSAIMIEILLKLQVKCLLQCKSVCKSWYSLISHPQFVKTHLRLSTSYNDYAHHHRIMLIGPRNTFKSCPLYDMMRDKTVNSIELDVPFKDACKIFFIVGYCHGLLCFKVGRDVFICNPSTRRYNRILDSRIGSQVYGFGYDESSEDYKLVVISHSGTKGKIYSLKSGKWKKIDDFPCPFCLVDYRCEFSNGALHWIGDLSKFDLSNTRKIVSLDLANETYGEVKQPMHDGGYTYLTIGALGECLSLLYDYGGNRVDVWVMKVYGVQGSWTKIASIQNLTEFRRDLRSSTQYSRLPTLCFANEGKILFECDWKLVLYDIKNGTLSEIKNCDTCLEACAIVESLVSPDGPRRRSKRLG